MFNKRVGVLYTLIKHDPRVYWTTSKTFLEKRVSMELITMTLLWTLEAYEKSITYEIIVWENEISHVFRNFPVYERH